MTAIFVTLDAILGFANFIIIASAIFSWLFAFNVINSSNQFVSQIGTMLYQLTEPLYRPIRRFIPAFNGIDLSPIVVLMTIFFLRVFLQTSIAPALGVVY
ncbi:MAG: YggT family protein [Rhizobiales bacterium]|nr:YggT family protein [Hyphomicrobiales bacterium]